MHASHPIVIAALLSILPPAAWAGENPPSPSEKTVSPKQDAPAEKKPKPAKTKDAESKTASQSTGKPDPKPIQPRGFATEGDARTKCGRADVVWRDGDGINHYTGSREYGKKPGAFACEQ